MRVCAYASLLISSDSHEETVMASIFHSHNSYSNTLDQPKSFVSLHGTHVNMFLQ